MKMVFQDKIKQYYENPDIYEQPGLHENLPNVFLESLAMGVPAIATNIAGIPQLIKHRETGILVPPDDIEELTPAIKLLLVHKELANRFPESGRRFVCQHFDSQDCLDQPARICFQNATT